MSSSSQSQFGQRWQRCLHSKRPQLCLGSCLSHGRLARTCKLLRPRRRLLHPVPRAQQHTRQSTSLPLTTSGSCRSRTVCCERVLRTGGPQAREHADVCGFRLLGVVVLDVLCDMLMFATKCHGCCAVDVADAINVVGVCHMPGSSQQHTISMHFSTLLLCC